MMFSTYCRIENAAGGVWASDRAFIKAARAMIRPDARRSFKWRARRHRLYRNALAERNVYRHACIKWLL